MKPGSKRNILGGNLAALFCAFGLFVIGLGASGCSQEAVSQTKCDPVQVVLEDGTPLEKRLDNMEQNMEKNQAAMFENTKKLLTRQRLIDMADMPDPLVLVDLEKAGALAVKGPEVPLITIIEFSDFQCPYCARMGLVLLELYKKHPDQIKIVFVDRPLVSDYRDGYPFHPYAFIAHEAAAEAKAQGKFWVMYEFIFENQQSLFPGRPSSKEDYETKQKQVREKLIQAAGDLGLDQAKMRKSLENHAHAKRLDKTVEICQKLGINSTPTVYANAYFKMSNPNLVLEMIDRKIVIE